MASRTVGHNSAEDKRGRGRPSLRRYTDEDELQLATRQFCWTQLVTAGISRSCMSDSEALGVALAVNSFEEIQEKGIHWNRWKAVVRARREATRPRVHTRVPIQTNIDLQRILAPSKLKVHKGDLADWLYGLHYLKARELAWLAVCAGYWPDLTGSLSSLQGCEGLTVGDVIKKVRTAIEERKKIRTDE